MHRTGVILVNVECRMREINKKLNTNKNEKEIEKKKRIDEREIIKHTDKD